MSTAPLQGPVDGRACTAYLVPGQASPVCSLAAPVYQALSSISRSLQENAPAAFSAGLLPALLLPMIVDMQHAELLCIQHHRTVTCFCLSQTYLFCRTLRMIQPHCLFGLSQMFLVDAHISRS